jgi:hypothetical protein
MLLLRPLSLVVCLKFCNEIISPFLTASSQHSTDISGDGTQGMAIILEEHSCARNAADGHSLRTSADTHAVKYLKTCVDKNLNFRIIKRQGRTNFPKSMSYKFYAPGGWHEEKFRSEDQAVLDATVRSKRAATTWPPRICAPLFIFFITEFYLECDTLIGWSPSSCYGTKLTVSEAKFASFIRKKCETYSVGNIIWR